MGVSAPDFAWNVQNSKDGLSPKKTVNVHINVEIRHFRSTIVAGENQ